MDQEVRAEVLYAYPGSNADLGTKTNTMNNSSLVLRLEYANQSFLFMGDAEGKAVQITDSARYVEKILLDRVPQKLKATVLKIGHHGS